MRMYFLFFLLLLPLTANAATCPAAGQYLNSGVCINCDEPDEDGQGYYCPPNDDTKHLCPEPFKTTDGGGKSDITDCKIKITKCVDEHTLPTPIYISCHQWNSSNTTCDSTNVPTYNVQRNPNESGHPKVAYEWTRSLKIGGYGMDSTPPDTNYHWESKPLFSAYQTGMDHYNTWLSTDFKIVCVPDTINCDYFRNFPQNTDLAVGAPIMTTHFGNNSEDTIGTNCPSGSTISGEATWVEWDNTVQSHWIVENCKCTVPSNELLDDKNCYGSGTKDANTSTNNVVYTVNTIYENVIYQTSFNDDITYCTRCKEDTGQSKYFVGNGYDTNTNTVSYCTEAKPSNNNAYFPYLGYYREPAQPGYCGGDTNWDDLSANPCPRVACSTVGTTTNELLPIKEATIPIERICVYGTDTQICDGNASDPHCTTLDGTGGLSLGDWNLLISIP